MPPLQRNIEVKCLFKNKRCRIDGLTSRRAAEKAFATNSSITKWQARGLECNSFWVAWWRKRQPSPS